MVTGGAIKGGFLAAPRIHRSEGLILSMRSFVGLSVTHVNSLGDEAGGKGGRERGKERKVIECEGGTEGEREEGDRM